MVALPGGESRGTALGRGLAATIMLGGAVGIATGRRTVTALLLVLLVLVLVLLLLLAKKLGRLVGELARGNAQDAGRENRACSGSA